MNNNLMLNDRVAIVTGAARGIGRAICKSLCEAGAHVIAADILEDQLIETANECGDRVSTVRLDVTDEQQWQHTVADTLKKHERIDILINNAGILLLSTLEQTTAEQFRKILDINVTGSFLGLQAVIPTMKDAGSGVIINLSSSSAILPNNAAGAYASSKYAIRGLTRTAALELGPQGIRVNSVHPGGVNTPI